MLKKWYYLQYDLNKKPNYKIKLGVFILNIFPSVINFLLQPYNALKYRYLIMTDKKVRFCRDYWMSLGYESNKQIMEVRVDEFEKLQKLLNGL